MSKTTISIISVLSIVTVSICIDCSCGENKHHECFISGKRYVPPYTETSVEVDSDKSTHVIVVNHPEEYHIECSEYGSQSLYDVQMSPIYYAQATNNQSVIVKTRQGKWTKFNYLPTIVD